MLGVDLPAEGLETLTKRFIQAFGSVGSLGFVLMTFTVAAGIAGSPALLSRAGTTPGVYEARKSVGWAVLVVGVVMLTLPAVAVYLRTLLLEQVVGQPGDRLPIWFQLLQQAGIARVDSKTPGRRLVDIGFERDAVLFALPIAAGFPQALVYLSLAGALAAALAALARLPGRDRRYRRRGRGAWPAQRDGAGRRPYRHRAGGLARCGVRDGVAGDRGAGRSAAAVPVGAHTQRLGVVSRPGAGDLVETGQRLGCAGGHDRGIRRRDIRYPPQRDRCGCISQRAGGHCRFARGAGRGDRRQHADARAGAHMLEIVLDVRVPGGETLYDREMRLLRLKNRNPT